MLSLSSAETPKLRPPAVRRRPDLRPRAALRALPCHRLQDGALAGAELIQAEGAPALDAVGQAWLLRAACQEASAWAGGVPCAPGLDAPGLSTPGLSVTVALPRHGVRNGTLLAQVEAALLGAGLPGQTLVVALPQADLADAGPDLLLLVSAMRDLGAHVALDSQERTGGLEQILRRFPLNTVRLHPALVRQAEGDADARAALSRVVRLAHAVDASAVALGVESAPQRDAMADLRCDMAQGRLFGRDLPGSVFRAGLG